MLTIIRARRRLTFVAARSASISVDTVPVIEVGEVTSAAELSTVTTMDSGATVETPIPRRGLLPPRRGLPTPSTTVDVDVDVGVDTAVDADAPVDAPMDVSVS